MKQATLSLSSLAMFWACQRAALQHSVLATDRPSLAPFDDLGYPFSLIALSVNRMKLAPGGGSRVQEMSRTAFVGDQMTVGGQKGFGMTKHGRSGHATRSPRFRFLQKLEAQKNDRKDRSRIKDPKQSVEELFHPRKPT
jgi:hypothetical protein